MYSKFDFKLTNSFYNTELNKYLEVGKKEYDDFNAKVKRSLKNFIYDNGKIDGTSLKEHWFNIVDADVFISHSHQDIGKVKAFAGWLKYNFNLTCFIDSCVWGYCDELLKQIDDAKCKNSNSSTYSYELRNYTTSHVHMMLSTALTEMMDNTECVIFFNTPNSINMAEELGKVEKKEKTVSPWIYHELSMTTLLRQSEPIRKKAIIEHYAQQRADEFSVAYDVAKPLEGLKTLTDTDLLLWQSNWQKRKIKAKEEALDALYEIVFPIKK